MGTTGWRGEAARGREETEAADEETRREEGGKRREEEADGRDSGKATGRRASTRAERAGREEETKCKQAREGTKYKKCVVPSDGAGEDGEGGGGDAVGGGGGSDGVMATVVHEEGDGGGEGWGRARGKGTEQPNGRWACG